jgi:hypothetical protein
MPGATPFHSLRSFHYERPIFPLLPTQLLQKQCYATEVNRIEAVLQETPIAVHDGANMLVVIGERIESDYRITVIPVDAVDGDPIGPAEGVLFRRTRLGWNVLEACQQFVVKAHSVPPVVRYLLEHSHSPELVPV